MITRADLQIVIPSRQRPAEASHAVTLWPRDLVSVCIDGGESEAYRRLDAEVVTHPPVRGLGELRQWILDHYTSKCVVMCNDDVTAIRCLTGRRPRSLTDPESILQVMLNAANACDALHISIFCFSPTVVPMRLDPFKPIRFTRIEGALFGMVGRKLRFDPKVRNHDDLDLSLQALLKERIVYQDARFGAEHNFFTKAGGNSGNRGTMREELAYLTAKWGQYLTVLSHDPSLSGMDARGVPRMSLQVAVRRQQEVEV